MADFWVVWGMDSVLAVTGADAKEAFGTEKFCGGLEAESEEGIHVVRLL